MSQLNYIFDKSESVIRCYYNQATKHRLVKTFLNTDVKSNARVFFNIN